MNAQVQAVAIRENNSPSMQFRDQLTKMDHELSSALPPHIPVERFMRIVLTAVNGNPDLLKSDRRTLFEAAMKAAQDGLLPDGRDGAFVTFGNKVQWMPMVGGILKKVRNSGDLLTIAAHVAYEKDTFKYSLGDEEKIEHIPSLLDDRGKPAIVYAVAKTKDGGIYREVMSIRDVEKVRNVSKAKNNGPWVQWWDEMAKKTVIRRLAKRLPMSSDLDDLIRRDDELYDFKGQRAEAADQHGAIFEIVKNPLADDEPAADSNSSQDNPLRNEPETTPATDAPLVAGTNSETDVQRETADNPLPSAPRGDEPRASEQEPLSNGSGEAQDRMSESASPPIQETTPLPANWQQTYLAAMSRVTPKPKSLVTRHTEALAMIGGSPSDDEKDWMKAVYRLTERRLKGEITREECDADIREIS